MPQTTTTIAKEKSTYIITCTFTDEDGNAVTPDSITWTLTDTDGIVINSREDVSVSVPAATVYIVLSGDDLQILSAETDEYVNRLCTVEWVYDSDAGSDLPGKDVLRFPLENLTAVS